MTTQPRSTGDVSVRWSAVPPVLLLDVLAAIEALQRDVQLSGLAGDAPVGSDVERGLVEDRARVQAQRDELHDQAAEARAEGSATFDVVVAYSSNELDLVLSAADAVASADRAAHRGELLVPPLTDDERHLWTWMVEQIRGQAAGEAAVPFRPRP